MDEGRAIDTVNLTWREKLQILELNVRIAVAMMLTCVGISELVVVFFGL